NAELTRLEQIKANLVAADREAIVARAQALKERQAKPSGPEDEAILPKVGLEDIPRALAYTPRHQQLDTPIPLTTYRAGTNGLVYQQIIHPLPDINDDLLDLLPIYSNVLAELGVGNRSYLETQLWQSRVCGSIHAAISARGTPLDLADLRGHLTLSAKGLQRNQEALTELMLETLAEVRFDELDRLKDLIAQLRARREKSITGNGHALAMSAAASGIGPGAQLAYRWG